MADTADLDAILAAARTAGADASEDFLARVLADAYAMQPQPQPAAVVAVPAASGWRARLVASFSALGGMWAAAGLATATLAGVWIGFARPDLVGGLGLAWTGAQVESIELLPTVDAWLTEG